MRFDVNSEAKGFQLPTLFDYFHMSVECGLPVTIEAQ